MRRARTVLLIMSLAVCGVFGQTTKPTNENGALNLNFNGGWSFGFPAVRASVSVPGVGSAISPERKALPIINTGVGLRAWKCLVPFVDFTAIDTGKAWAQVGTIRSEVQADTYAVNGGLRVIGSKGRMRPYVQFGGGTLRQNLRGNFIVAGRSTPVSSNGSAGLVTYGAGLQVFVGRKWGSMMGFDGFHVTQPVYGAGQNFSRAHFGFFYQSKVAAE